MNASSRNCARGERCTQYARLGKPASLSSYNKNSICEACRLAEPKVESEQASPTSPTNDRATEPKSAEPLERGEGKVLDSSAQAEIRSVKNKLVISLFLKRGAFWEMVKETREHWNITPDVRVPPSTMGPLDLKFPLRTPNPYTPKGWPDPYEDSERCEHLTISWAVDIRKIQDQMVPEKYRDKGAPGEMDRFLSACVLYDPPETELLEFAKISDPEPEAFYGSWAPDEFDPDESVLRMLAPPVRTLRDLTESEDWALDCIIYDHGERMKSLMKSLGFASHQLLTELEKEDPELRERYRRKVERDEGCYFIEVDEHTSPEDVANAFRMIRAVQKRNLGGRPGRDELVALQCAVLHDRYNQPDPTDRRRRKWTHKRLAEKFGLKSARAAEEYVATGREILEEN